MTMQASIPVIMNIGSGDILLLEDSEGFSAVVVRNRYDDLGFSYNARTWGEYRCGKVFQSATI